MGREDRVDTISGAQSMAEMAEFWDTHDATEYEDQTYEVDIEFNLKTRRHYVAIDPDVLARLREQATKRGISLESLAKSLASRKSCGCLALS